MIVTWLASAVALFPLAAQEPEMLPTSLANVGFDQRLDAPVPTDLTFTDESGRTVRLGDYLGAQPAILVLVQYECPMLCGLTLNGLVDVLDKLPFTVGRDFHVITVSFDPRETPALGLAKKAAYIERLDRPGAENGWHFLTGEDDAIDRLSRAVGFRYTYDAEHDRFAHPSGLVVLTPQGKIARYFFGVEYFARDVRLGLVEASQNKIGSAVDQVMLLCYGYDPKTGRYTATVRNVVRAGGVLTLLGIGLFIVWTSVRRTRDKTCEPTVPARGT